MRWVLRVGGVVLAVIVAFFGSTLLLSEAAEVVVLETRDAAGEAETTRLWIVEGDGFAWLRAGGSDRRWYRRAVAEPSASLTRDGRTRRYRLIPVQTPEARARVTRWMAEKYGLADRMVGLFRDYEAAIPIRLEEEPAD